MSDRRIGTGATQRGTGVRHLATLVAFAFACAAPAAVAYDAELDEPAGLEDEEAYELEERGLGEERRGLGDDALGDEYDEMEPRERERAFDAPGEPEGFEGEVGIDSGNSPGGSGPSGIIAPPQADTAPAGPDPLSE